MRRFPGLDIVGGGAQVRDVMITRTRSILRYVYGTLYQHKLSDAITNSSVDALTISNLTVKILAA